MKLNTTGESSDACPWWWITEHWHYNLLLWPVSCVCVCVWVSAYVCLNVCVWGGACVFSRIPPIPKDTPVQQSTSKRSAQGFDGWHGRSRMIGYYFTLHWINGNAGCYLSPRLVSSSGSARKTQTDMQRRDEWSCLCACAASYFLLHV